MSEKIRGMIKHKQKLRYKIKSKKDKSEYRRQCIKFTKSTKKEKLKPERELASKAKRDPKLIYTYIRNKMDVKEQIRALKIDEGMLIVDRSDIADILSNQFESVFVHESLVPLPEFEKRTIVSFEIERVLSKINEYEIEKSLKNLKESKSMGPDQIHPMTLKNAPLSFQYP